MMDFSTEKFSGPLGLLLQLIEQEEMDITEINLAKIADEYVAHLKQVAEIDPEEMADFLVIAAKLLFIKSKALLPYLASADDEQEIDDLKNQLRMYQEFIKASAKILAIIEQRKFLYVPDFSKTKKRFNLPSFLPPQKIKADDLKLELQKIIRRLKMVEDKIPTASLEVKISLDEIMMAIRRALSTKLKFSFNRLISQAKNKTEVIVSFLAILELAKQRELIFEQTELFSEIHLSKNN
ncbi:MAG: segregation/condensation protein A [Candidatus Falkowbacteria bacterium]|nr:segregation/condensation protein A [Candidatus Falkowbacteria bacterium]